MGYYSVFSKIYEIEAKKMAIECLPFIEKNSKILDIGCGSGIVGYILKEFFKADLIGVDIIDRRVKNIPFLVIDGENLPFSENFFDFSFISYVLHHAKNQKKLLEEAKRVSKKIIVFEDLADGLFNKILCFIHQLTYKIFQKDSKIVFKNKNDWKRSFEEVGLKIIFEKEIFPVFYFLFPQKRILFILEKEK